MESWKVFIAQVVNGELRPVYHEGDNGNLDEYVVLN